MHNDSGRVTSWPNGWHGFLNEHSETTFVTARTHSLPDQRPLLAQAQLPAKLDEPRVKRLGWVAKMPEQRNRPGSWMLCARPRPMPSIHATPLLRIRLRPPTPMFFFEPSGSKDAQRFRLRSATHSERRVPRIGRLVLMNRRNGTPQPQLSRLSFRAVVPPSPSCGSQMDYGCTTAGANRYLAKRPLFLDTPAPLPLMRPRGRSHAQKSNYSCSGVKVNLVAGSACPSAE